jgi:hypothetical protein
MWIVLRRGDVRATLRSRAMTQTTVSEFVRHAFALAFALTAVAVISAPLLRMTAAMLA